MSKKNYKYVPCVKYGDNSGWMGDKFSTMQKAWDYLMEHKKKYDTINLKKILDYGLWRGNT